MNRQRRTGFIHRIMRIGSIAIRTGRDKNAALRIGMLIAACKWSEYFLRPRGRASVSRYLGWSIFLLPRRVTTICYSTNQLGFLVLAFPADLSSVPLSGQLYPLLVLSSPLILASLPLALLSYHTATLASSPPPTFLWPLKFYDRRYCCSMIFAPCCPLLPLPAVAHPRNHESDACKVNQS